MLYEIDMLGGVSNGVAVEKMDTPVADNESLVFMIEMIISELLSQILGGADVSVLFLMIMRLLELLTW